MTILDDTPVVLLRPEDAQVEPQVTGSYTRLSAILSGAAVYDNSRWNAINILPAASSASKAELPINPMGYCAAGKIYRIRPCWEGNASTATIVGNVRAYDRNALGQGETVTGFTQQQVVLDTAAPVAGAPEVWFRQETGSNFGYEVQRTDSAASSFRLYLYGMWVDEPAQPTLPANRSVTEVQNTLYAGTPTHDLRENYAWKLITNGQEVGYPLASMLFNGAGSYRFRPVCRIPTGIPAHTQLASIDQNTGSGVSTSKAYFSDSVPTTYSAGYSAQTDWTSAAALSPAGGVWPVLERWWNGSENVGSTRISFRLTQSSYPVWFAGWWVEWQDGTLFDAVVNTAAFGGYGYAISQWQPQPQGFYRHLPGSNYTAQGPPIEANINFTPTITKFGGGPGTYRVTPWVAIDSNAYSAPYIYAYRNDVCDTTRTDQTLIAGGERYVAVYSVPTGWQAKSWYISNGFSFNFNWDGAMSIQYRLLIPAHDWNATAVGNNWAHDRYVYLRGFWLDKL
jgi:hypothetical protein